jgi:protein piccolo
LSRDPNDQSIESNGIGVKLVGGKEIPGSNLLAAYVSKIFPGSLADTIEDINEGNSLFWNI